MRRRFSALSKKGNNPKGKAERVEPVELSITCPHVDEWNGRASLASIWVPGFLPSPISRSVSVRQPTQSQSICPRGVISGSADIRPIASWQPHAKCPLCFGTVPILIDKSRYLTSTPREHVNCFRSNRKVEGSPHTCFYSVGLLNSPTLKSYPTRSVGVYWYINLVVIRPRWPPDLRLEQRGLGSPLEW